MEIKRNIWGFDQQALLWLELDVIDVLILKWLRDFRDTEKMDSIFVEGIEYYWVRYQYIIDTLPILHTPSIRSIQRRFAHYVDSGILKRLVVKGKDKRWTTDGRSGKREERGRGGSYVYYAFDPQTWHGLIFTQEKR